MVETLTPICDFGWKPTDFKLLNVDGKHLSLKDCVGTKGTVVAFICNHCPFVKAIQQNLINDGLALQQAGVNMIFINANDADTYPEDSYDNMQRVSEEMSYPFPYLWDEDQQVAQSWGAVCTPDFFGFNADLELQYRGRLDESGRQANPNCRRELLEAMQQVIATGKGPKEQTPSIGCSIKWKS